MSEDRTKFPFVVPGNSHFSVDTPSTFTMMQLLGTGGSFEGVTLSRDQDKRLMRFYGFDDAIDVAKVVNVAQEAEAKYQEKLSAWKKAAALDTRAAWDAYRTEIGKRYGFGPEAEPDPPKVDPEATLEFYQTGATRNMHRFMRRDGLRIMAFLSRFLQEGQDPVKLVAQMAIESGYDVPDDHDWIEEE